MYGWLNETNVKKFSLIQKWRNTKTKEWNEIIAYKEILESCSKSEKVWKTQINDQQRALNRASKTIRDFWKETTKV